MPLSGEQLSPPRAEVMLQPAESGNNPGALEVRAHRFVIPNLMGVVTERDIPLEVEDMLICIIDPLHRSKAKPANIRYAHDVVGTNTREEVDSVKDGWSAFLRKYVLLQDNAPIHLIAGKDGICNSCVIAKHCDKDQKDTQAMEEFIAWTRRLGNRYPAEYRPVIENGKLQRVETNKKTVSAVVAIQKGLWYQRPPKVAGTFPLE